MSAIELQFEVIGALLACPGEIAPPKMERSTKQAKQALNLGIGA